MSDKAPTEKERLFNYFYQEHGITLLESQMEEIITLVPGSQKEAHNQALDEAVEAVEEAPKVPLMEHGQNWPCIGLHKATTAINQRRR